MRIVTTPHGSPRSKASSPSSANTARSQCARRALGCGSPRSFRCCQRRHLKTLSVSPPLRRVRVTIQHYDTRVLFIPDSRRPASQACAAERVGGVDRFLVLVRSGRRGLVLDSTAPARLGDTGGLQQDWQHFWHKPDRYSLPYYRKHIACHTI